MSRDVKAASVYEDVRSARDLGLIALGGFIFFLLGSRLATGGLLEGGLVGLSASIALVLAVVGGVVAGLSVLGAAFYLLRAVVRA